MQFTKVRFSEFVGMISEQQTALFVVHEGLYDLLPVKAPSQVECPEMYPIMLPSIKELQGT